MGVEVTIQIVILLPIMIKINTIKEQVSQKERYQINNSFQ